VAIETLNLSMERKFASTFQMEGVQIYTQLQIEQKVLIDPQIMMHEPFDESHYKRA
jgi:hypothetical protein